jgi:hypothetical protein
MTEQVISPLRRLPRERFSPLAHLRRHGPRPRRPVTGVLRSRCLPLGATLPFYKADFKINSVGVPYLRKPCRHTYGDRPPHRRFTHAATSVFKTPSWMTVPRMTIYGTVGIGLASASGAGLS